MDSLEERVARLLDQLEDPTLTERQVAELKDKVMFIQSLQK